MCETWKLSKEQSVTFVAQKLVTFSQRKHGAVYSIHLSFCQIDILRDIIDLIEVKGASNLYIPLGNGIVFMMRHRDRPSIQYFKKRRHSYFVFTTLSWNRFIRHIFKRLRSLLRYDRRNQDCQCALADENNAFNRYSENTSYFDERDEYSDRDSERKQILSRSSKHDSMEDEWSNRSIFRRRSHSNDRETCYADFSFKDEEDCEISIEDENGNVSS